MSSEARIRMRSTCVKTTETRTTRRTEHDWELRVTQDMSVGASPSPESDSGIDLHRLRRQPRRPAIPRLCGVAALRSIEDE